MFDQATVSNADATPLLAVPGIDFSPWRASDDVGKQQVTVAIDRACREVGFLY